MKNSLNDNDLINSEESFEPPSMLTVIDECKKINTVFIRAMDKIQQIIDLNKVTEEDIAYLKALNIYYSPLTQKKYAFLNEDKDLKRNILEATLLETYVRAQEFFNINYFVERDEKLNAYKNKFIQFGIEIDFMLKFLIKLKNLLECLYLDFVIFLFSLDTPTMEEEFDFIYFLKKANKENDLRKRKQIYINAIAEYDMSCIIDDIDSNDEIIHEAFKQKCQKAIAVIDNQLQHTSSPAPIPEPEQTIDKIHKFRLSKSRKTDFIKIVSAMYDTRMFETENGFIVSNKQALIVEFGTILGEDFSNYSVLLSQSKNADKTAFLKPFTDIQNKAGDSYDQKLEK